MKTVSGLKRAAAAKKGEEIQTNKKLCWYAE